jgi:hypothetical protein
VSNRLYRITHKMLVSKEVSSKVIPGPSSMSEKDVQIFFDSLDQDLQNPSVQLLLATSVDVFESESPGNNDESSRSRSRAVFKADVRHPILSTGAVIDEYVVEFRSSDQDDTLTPGELGMATARVSFWRNASHSIDRVVTPSLLDSTEPDELISLNLNLMANVLHQPHRCSVMVLEKSHDHGGVSFPKIHATYQQDIASHEGGSENKFSSDGPSFTLRWIDPAGSQVSLGKKWPLHHILNKASVFREILMSAWRSNEDLIVKKLDRVGECGNCSLRVEVEARVVQFVIDGWHLGGLEGKILGSLLCGAPIDSNQYMSSGDLLDALEFRRRDICVCVFQENLRMRQDPRQEPPCLKHPGRPKRPWSNLWSQPKSMSPFLPTDVRVLVRIASKFEHLGERVRFIVAQKNLSRVHSPTLP